MSDLILPVPVLDDLELAFPSGALEWMPPWDEIPAEFRNMNRATEWNEIVSQWFFFGLSADVEFHAKEGVDAEAAYRVVAATLGSYAPKHEHKEAAAAYMLSCWFDKVEKWKK